MWDLGNRSVVALVSALSGCVLLYNVWGPILILAVSLFLTIYACYSLIVNDSLLSPHAFLLLDYCKHTSLEVYANYKVIADHIYRYSRQLLEAGNRRFRNRYLTQTRSTMERRRGSHYQLSNDPYPTNRNSSNFESSNDMNSKNGFYHRPSRSLHDHTSFDVKHTSTPLFPRAKEELENQTFKLSPSERMLPKRASSTYRQNHATSQQENTSYFAAEGSPWNSCSSLKADRKPTDKKTVQAVAGPLLTSTRYNIDPKVYNDVTSPGLTGRLTRYAEEANKKLTHGTQYCVGQFPKVNLHASPVPLINAKSVKTKTPVTVRVAPPHTIRYSPTSKQSTLTTLHYSDRNCSPSVAQTLREMSLKRHASRDDVTSDLVKKQRTDGLPGNEFEVQDETKQKRSREESLRSEEDSSPQSKSIRPTKRTKTPSCYDIINSLSSSKHVVSGVKRKARDFSRSGTPDFEKHFKSLEYVQSTSTQTLPQTPNANRSPRTSTHEVTETGNNSDAYNRIDKPETHSPLKGILKTSNKSPESESDGRRVHAKRTNVESNEKDRSKEPAVSTESAKLTHKLFMRAEPERNEKLRMLVEEQGNIRAKFTTDDVEEIKREDIADMRQTSMKARLQSMFDAISGKATSGINPDVVIQAEEINSIKSVECPVTCATLNSSTTTTNVNTTPISTSAVAPNFGSSELVAKSPKHVAFNLPKKENATSTNAQFANQTTSVASAITFTAAESKVAPESIISNANKITSSSNCNVQNFNLGKSTSNASIPSTSSMQIMFTSDAASAKSNPSSLAVPTTTPTNIFATVSTAASTATTNIRNEPNRSNSKTSTSQATAICSSNLGATVASDSTISVSSNSNPLLVNTTTVAKKKEQSTDSASTGGLNVNATSFANNTSSASSAKSLTMTTSVGGSTPLFTFSNNPPTVSKPEGFVFGSQSGGMFGCSATTSGQTSTTNIGTASTSSESGARANSTTSVITGNSFNPNAKTSASTFGSSSNSTFTFTSMPASSATDGKAGFSFGSTSAATNATTVGNSNNNSAPNFATLSSSGNAIQFTPNTGSIFANSSSSPSVFGTTTTSNQQTSSAFGMPSNLNATTVTFALPKSTATSVFGSNVAATTSVGFASTSSVPIFSNINGGSSSATTSTTSIPVFGSTVNTPASGTIAAGGTLFSATNVAATTSSFPTTSNIFGQTNPSTVTNNLTVSGVFGSSNSSALFSTQATTSSTFTTTNVSSNSSSAPTFGSTNIPASNVTAFRVPNTAPSAFGLQNQSKENAAGQGASSQSFGVGSSSIFAATGENTAVPVFGSSTSSSAGPFGSSASRNTFTGQNHRASSSNPNPTFGTVAAANANSPPAFGDSNKVSPFAAQTSAFGTAGVSTSAFGNANENNNNTSAGIFTFGANQKPPQSNTAVFSFGSNNNTGNSATVSTSTPFQFGSTTSNSGFHFSAPSTTPSINFGTTSSTTTFNVSTPGMFSIGSGSTAPRSRNIRTRKLR